MAFSARRLWQRAWVPMSFLAATLSAPTLADDAEHAEVNMTQGVTGVSHQIYDLHMLIFWICVVIGVLVFGFMFWSIFAYRKSRGAVASDFHESTKVEILWTIIPFFILVGMAWPATKTLLNIYDTSKPDLNVMVTGYQWKWKYEYLLHNGGPDVSFFSNLATPDAEIYGSEPKGEHYLRNVDHPLVLPVGRKVRFLITSADVIHSWWVPDFGVKRDAIPGYINETWARPDKTGIYRGQCAELCGKGHGFMPIVVHVVSDQKFNDWIGKQQAEAKHIKELMSQTFTHEQMMARGKKIYGTTCVACHGDKGQGGVGKPIAGSPVATGPLKNHLHTVIYGVAGTAMQAFGTQLNDLDLAAVVTFERNAFGNHTGDTVQAVDVYNFKKSQ